MSTAGDKVICTLPSGQSACRLVQGDMSALPTVLGHMLGRSLLVGAGLYFAGFRDRQLVKGALAGAMAIEAAVLLYTTVQVRRAEAEAEEREHDEAPTVSTEPKPIAQVTASGLRRRLGNQQGRVVVAQLPAPQRAPVPLGACACQA